jgi:hypothetical protein
MEEAVRALTASKRAGARVAVGLSSPAGSCGRQERKFKVRCELLVKRKKKVKKPERSPTILRFRHSNMLDDVFLHIHGPTFASANDPHRRRAWVGHLHATRFGECTMRVTHHCDNASINLLIQCPTLHNGGIVHTVD